MSDALKDGLRLLAGRALTRSEVARRLSERGHDAEAIDAALLRLAAVSALDDLALARQWIVTRAGERGRGRLRTLAELHARGVDESIASTAWAEAMADGALDEDAALARAVRRRLGDAPGRADRARLARVYNALLAEGFAREQLEAALSPYGFERNDS